MHLHCALFRQQKFYLHLYLQSFLHFLMNLRINLSGCSFLLAFTEMFIAIISCFLWKECPKSDLRMQKGYLCRLLRPWDLLSLQSRPWTPLAGRVLG